MTPKPHLRARHGTYAAVETGRQAGAMVESQHRGASRYSRDVAAWVPFKGSADSDLLPDLDVLVSRTRDLERNNGVAAGGVRTILDNVVGTGLRLVPKPDYDALKQTPEWAEAWSQDVNSLWQAYFWTTACHAGDTLTGDQLTRQVHHSVISNGEALELPLWLPGRDDFATKLQTIEADRLSNPGGSTFINAAATPNMRGGIKFDDNGVPLTYSIRKAHPGDAVLGLFRADLYQWVEIPRRMPTTGRLRVLHQFDSERAGQSRGKSPLASVLSNFKQIDRYVEAEIMAAVSNAMIAGTITTPLEHEEILELFRGDPDKYMAARMDGRTKIESGTFVPLFPGDKLEAFIPGRPATAFGSFVDNVFRIIGCALDLPAILLLKDFSQVNYSSARAALLEAWRSFNRQRDWLGTMFLDPWYALWLEEVINDGRIAAPVDYYANRAAYNRCRWIGPARGWVDPVKEIDAVGQRIALRLSTMEDECAEQGKDWREVARQQAVEKKFYTSLGLAYPGDAAPAKRGGPNSAFVPPEAPYPSDAPTDQGKSGGGNDASNTDNADTGGGDATAPAQQAA